MSSHEKGSSEFDRASTVLDSSPRAAPAVSDRPVTVVGPSLRFSHRPEAGPLYAGEFVDRYAVSGLLGVGGMGEVRLSHDARIGREVAMKVIRADRGDLVDLRARFLREVRIQGQLEHPSIVPVYDLGVGADEATYFTMRRIRGLTLADIVDRLRLKDPVTMSKYSPRKLLTAFLSVCLAVEFAHSRGVLHRDLKPSNVMLGDFGEVYVLDWGIAKIVGERDEVAPTAIDSGEDLETQVGSFLGTLGYLAPEQFSGEDLDRRSDVFSLGSILFEILTLIPLFEGSPLKVAQAVAEQVEARCSVRAPERDVPPELEEICVNATKLDRDQRCQTARALHDAIERYLDGDRDLERRKALSLRHLETAEKALSEVGEKGKGVTSSRSKALNELGRALALDPANDVALSGIVTLLLEPPAEIPLEVTEKIISSTEDSLQQINMTGIAAFGGGTMLLFPLLILMGVMRWTPLILSILFLSVAFGACLLQVRRSSPQMNLVVLFSSAGAYVVLSRLLGPLVLMPTITMATAMVFAMNPSKRIQRLALLVMSLATIVPFALECIHVLPQSYLFEDGHLIVVPQICALPPFATLALLSVLPTLLLLVAGVGLVHIRNALTAAEARLALQAWQFRQLVPDRARLRLRDS